jgi:A/G-specific adenine glycosylase
MHGNQSNAAASDRRGAQSYGRKPNSYVSKNGTMTPQQAIASLERIRSGHYRTEGGAVRAFQRTVLDFYQACARSFEWRLTRDPYRILVSEVMLQQTQTSRVAERYPLFLKQFPSVKALALADQAQVLRAWQGLGYYRRARNLHQAARAVEELFGGRFPRSHEELCSLPGVGAYTAAAVAAFAYNYPVPMLETNIRSVFLYTFFPKQKDVSDKEVMEYVRKTLVTDRSRDWFYALMDLGVELKRVRPKINQASKHHAVQSPFKGSDRAVAAQVLRFILGSARAVSASQVLQGVKADEAQVNRAIERLVGEHMIVRTETGRLRHS